MHRLFVEKTSSFASESAHLIADLRANLAIDSIKSARIVQRYDLDGLSAEEFQKASQLILSEPQVETSSTELSLAPHESAFALEFLPGQFDQRADSAAQCVQILTGKDRPFVSSARVIIFKGTLSDDDLAAIKKYLINPVDSHEVSVTDDYQRTESPEPKDVAILTGFNTQSEADFDQYRSELGLAMSTADLVHTQKYFLAEGREPTITELRMLDTYWSDHCRHTTFMSAISKVTFDEGTDVIEDTYKTYLQTRDEVYGPDTDRPVSLMDIALMGMKELRKTGELDNVEISNEINAASIVVKADDGEEWLVQFKNETHNHPTEIEPFGGAATCLGGCIRDPLSGRSYVYQAMRVTGAADPRTPYDETIPGKLPQRKICQESARGYSSYGNQIGLATGKVSEVYHPNYAAKRMEIGAVVSASPRKNVFRGGPDTGDFILLIGGRTGRDGVGGATGSSKEHTDDALDNSAEVQKGDAPTERKIQRLFRNPELAPKIKICNDFGAGGVSVAIGEIAESLDLDLDAVPKKYDGLDGTELAISESQERMAICVDPADAPYFIAESDKENLECVHVATVTDTGRLRMSWRGKYIVDLSREFLDTNGVQQEASVHVENVGSESPLGCTAFVSFPEALSDLNIASQKGLGEMFDSSVGAGTVLAPFGGKHQRTPVDAMVATLPFLDGHSEVCTHMSWGFNPNIATWSPYHGAAYAVTESVCRNVASGAKLSEIRLTLQEYFPKLGEDPARWGLPFAALLGAFKAQHELRLGAIGGKDSMSGTFN
ncbi:MAG: phosphoribosylformylglycinamidine synthase, partial [Akkermansiaceae bacterium]